MHRRGHFQIKFVRGRVENTGVSISRYYVEYAIHQYSVACCGAHWNNVTQFPKDLSPVTGLHSASNKSNNSL